MRYISVWVILPWLLISACGIPTVEKAGLKFSTELSPVPAEMVWQDIEFAKELINQSKQLVVVSGGDNPVPLDEWDAFTPGFPWKKNIDRNLLFDKTCFYRSPDRPADCSGADCLSFHEYKGYTWVALAEPVAVAFVPEDEKTDLLHPDPGTLVIKTIRKCQALMYTDSICQLSDGVGNLYVMHATETGEPDLDVTLPAGWSISWVQLADTLIVSPFGGGDHCYFNILGDHLGQGYHQYRFADAFYPAD
ncbi:MAG: hypothetical protein NW241_07080 [Bacteroidia bacterium]|nr:hypothetical protein [Bacteroidia bacterium]